MSNTIRFLSQKSQSEITREWDQIAPIRDSQIAANADPSFSEVLEPWIFRHLGLPSSILDVGCGTGRLTAGLRERATTVVGIDPSSASVEIARQHDSSGSYEVSTVEEWAASRLDSHFDLVVANMVLMDTLHLEDVCASIARIAQKGRVVATITHPAFWPIYWGYAQAEGFSYSEELVVEAPFRTSTLEYPTNATHIHRPLDMYLETFRRNGIRITRFEELRGPEPAASFPFPRFIGVVAEVD